MKAGGAGGCSSSSVLNVYSVPLSSLASYPDALDFLNYALVF